MDDISFDMDDLFDIAMEAVAKRRDTDEDKAQKFVLPRLALMSKILPPKDAKIPDTIPGLLYFKRHFPFDCVV